MPWLLRISRCTWFSKMVSSWQRSFFPSLPGLVLNDVQQLNWEWNHQFGEIGDVMVGSKKERKKKWNRRPLVSSPFTVVALLGTLLLWSIKCLLFCWGSQSWIKTFETSTGHCSDPPLGLELVCTVSHQPYLAAGSPPPSRRARQTSCNHLRPPLHCSQTLRRRRDSSRCSFRPDRKTPPVLV